jgi:hypothetical protein
LCLGKKRETAKKNGVVRISWIGEMNLNVAFPDGSGLSSGSLKVANDGHGSVEPFGPRRPVLVISGHQSFHRPRRYRRFRAMFYHISKLTLP